MQVAERTISSDLELLISKTVNREKADYAVVTGVQVHNWATEFDNSEPNLVSGPPQWSPKGLV